MTGLMRGWRINFPQGKFMVCSQKRRVTAKEGEIQVPARECGGNWERLRHGRSRSSAVADFLPAINTLDAGPVDAGPVDADPKESESPGPGYREPAAEIFERGEAVAAKGRAGASGLATVSRGATDEQLTRKSRRQAGGRRYPRRFDGARCGEHRRRIRRESRLCDRSAAGRGRR
jgi:hypothetical protein